MYNIEEVIKEADKCLNCKNPLCRKGCPVETNIPGFINEIKNNNLKQAFYILQENNIMSDICSNVCPYEMFCSGHCVKGIKGESVKISSLEKYVNKWAMDNNIKYTYNKEPKNGIKIAVIGSGPAGLACSVELSKKGFEVTIFEKESEIGGLLTYGIPGFRLPRQITKSLTEKIKKLGIRINTNSEFGKNITIEKLRSENYKAIFIGIGAEISSTYLLTKNENLQIYNSDYILKEYNNKRTISSLGTTLIIGGGNVAIDSARASVRMGATSTTIVYRRSKQEMPARNVELAEALQDGVKIIYNTRIINVNDKDGIMQSANCIKTVTEDGKVKDLEKTNFKLEADSIVFAIGSKPNDTIMKSQGIEMEKGLIKINENLMTNIIGVFAGGDVTQNKSTVCNAINDGKRAAEHISKFLIP